MPKGRSGLPRASSASPKVIINGAKDIRSEDHANASRVSRRGSTPRGSSLDGAGATVGQPFSSSSSSSSAVAVATEGTAQAVLAQSSYVKHLEGELETMRRERTTMLQTVLDLKKENEENAQAAALEVDDVSRHDRRRKAINKHKN